MIWRTQVQLLLFRDVWSDLCSPEPPRLKFNCLHDILGGAIFFSVYYKQELLLRSMYDKVY